jgi:hypothetical protein
MTDNEIIKALECCSDGWSCESCAFDDEDGTMSECTSKLAKAALDLIHRQQKKIDELTDRTAIRAIDRIHYNIKELNLIQEGYNIAELKKRFRAEFEEGMDLGIVDRINWADWLDNIASELLEEAKVGGNDDR